MKALRTDLDEGSSVALGAWQKREYNASGLGSKWLQKQEGLVIYQLKGTRSNVEGVHDVEVSRPSHETLGICVAACSSCHWEEGS